MSPEDISDVLWSDGLGCSVNGDCPSAAMCLAMSARVRHVRPPGVDSDADGGLSPGCDGLVQLNGLWVDVLGDELSELEGGDVGL